MKPPATQGLARTEQGPSKKPEPFWKLLLRLMIYMIIGTAVFNLFRKGVAEAGSGLAIQLVFLLAIAVLIWGIDKGFRWGIDRVGKGAAGPVKAGVTGAVCGATCWGASSVAFFWALDAWMRSDGFS
jgi:uncharacterized membrane protein HdeD (DUF308 family)